METRDYIEILQFVIFAALVLIPLIQMRRLGQTVTVADVAAAVENAKPILERVRTVAEAAVLAQEQIKREGRITSEQAYAKAFAIIRSEFPPASGVTDDEIIREINRMVLIGSKMTADIEAAKAEK